METLIKVLKISTLFFLFCMLFGGVCVVSQIPALGIVFILIGVIPSVFIIRSFKPKTQEELDKIEENKKNKYKGYKKENILFFLPYKHGHPNIDRPNMINIGFKDKNIHFLNFKFDSVALIENEKIKNILVEDQTTFEKKVTLARMAMVGIFAFALKKNKKNELAYLTISWNDGRFDHDTIFEFQGIGSMTKANQIRNRMIKEIQ